MRQGSQGRCTGMTQRDGMGWGGMWEGASGWGTHVHPWLILVNVWQKPLQYYKVISLQLNKLIFLSIKKKNLPVMQETWVRSLGWEDPLEKGMATHSSILAWRILWTEEPSGRVGHD